MFSSVRVRLTIWYTAVMALVLAVLALSTYFILRQSSVRRTDESIVELSNSFLATVNAEAKDAPTESGLRISVLAALSEHRFRGTLYAVLDKSGEEVASSEDNTSTSDPAPNSLETFRQAVTYVAGGADRFKTVRLGRQQYRGYVRRFFAEGESFGLVVLQSLRDQDEFLESVIEAFALIIPLALLLAGTGGYFLARQSLSPVVAMGTQAGRIGSENLHQRLKVENSKDELGQLALSFNDLLDRLGHSFEKQRRFVADASHELRTPVAILCGEAEVTLAQPERSAQEYRASLEVLRAEAKRLKCIVEDLFTLARADAGQHPPTLANFYLDEVIAECVRNMRALASAKEIALHYEPATELPILADEALTRRMFVNLLDNAIKYTPRGGSIFVADSDGHSSAYRITIRDTGKGISPEIQARVFERFFRADEARSRPENDGGGAGLGLSISRWIAEMHGGKLELSQSDEKGSTFTVFLPVAASRR